MDGSSSTGLRRVVRTALAAVITGLLAMPQTAAGQETGSVEGTESMERALRILAEHPVFDGHNDLPWEIRVQRDAPMDVDAYDLGTRTPGQTDIERLRRGRVGAQFWSVYVPGEYADSGFARVQLEQIDIALRMIRKYPELELALTAGEVEAIMARGGIASLLGAEGGHAIENSLGALRAYYSLGVRYMTLTHNVTLDWADAALDEHRHGGLTPFGERVVREMNRMGMLVDLSHASTETMSDAIRVSAAPVIFSHSSSRALTDVARNVPDSILARMADNGGVVMVTFVPPFVNAELAAWSAAEAGLLDSLAEEGASDDEVRRARERYRRDNPPPKVTLSDVADHVEHVRDVAGADHVGIGSDFDGLGTPPEGLEDVSTFPGLFAELVRRGWSDEDLGKLASGNIIRALRAAEEVAARMDTADDRTRAAAGNRE